VGCLVLLLFVAKLVMPQMGHAGVVGAMADDLIVICGTDGAKLVRILPNGDAEEVSAERGPSEPCPKCLTCDWCVSVTGGEILAAVDMAFPKPEIGNQLWRILEDTSQAHLQLIVPQVRGPPSHKPFSIWASLSQTKTALGHTKIEAPA